MAATPSNRGLLSRMLSSATGQYDAEANYSNNSQNLPEGTASPRPRPLTVITNEASALVPPQDRLLIFRTLTGIDTVPVVSSAGHTIRRAANIGIYTRVINHEQTAKRLYTVVKVIASICLGLQIIMSAAVTALGAAGGSYTGITGLGAVSTITASIVAYIKGSGQPQKLKYGMSRWKWIREYIEQRERELCLADCSLDVYREVRTVEEMYQLVKEELASDKNPGQGQQGAAGGAVGVPLSGLGGGGGGGLDRMSSVGGRAANEKMDGIEGKLGALGEKIGLSEKMSGLNDRLGSLRETGNETAAGYGDRFGSLRESATGLGERVSGMASTLREKADEAGQTANDLRDRAGDVGVVGQDCMGRTAAVTDTAGSQSCAKCNRPLAEHDKR